MADIDKDGIPTSAAAAVAVAAARKRMGRESDSLLLYRPKMSFGEAAMWFSFDVGLTLLRFVVPLGMLIVFAQNIWRVVEGKSFLQYHLPDDTLHQIEFVVEAWCVIELCFYGYIKWKAKKMATRKELMEFTVTTPAARKLLLDRVLKTVDSVEALIEQWFVDTSVTFDDLSRSDIAEITAYCFFHRRRHELSEEELDELEDMIKRFEETLGRPIENKVHTAAEEKQFEILMEKSAMFFTETEVYFQHRPLLMYLVVHYLFQELMTPFRMYYTGGYSKRYANNTRYWFRQSKSNPGKDCVVFFHGIGVGLLPYSMFLTSLEQLADQRGFDIVVVEIPVISQTFAPQPLLPEPFVEDIAEIIKACGFDRAKFITHSYGSFCVNWVVTRRPDLINGLMLIDPAAILLHQTDILYNMLYRTASRTSLDRVLHYVMRSEIHFVYHLKREFFWFHNTMFFEAFPKGTKVGVVVSEADQVIPVRRIVQYAEERGVDCTMLNGCDHGGFLVTQKHLSQVIASIENWLDTMEGQQIH